MRCGYLIQLSATTKTEEVRVSRCLALFLARSFRADSISRAVCPSRSDQMMRCIVAELRLLLVADISASARLQSSRDFPHEARYFPRTFSHVSGDLSARVTFTLHDARVSHSMHLPHFHLRRASSRQVLRGPIARARRKAGGNADARSNRIVRFGWFAYLRFHDRP